MTPRLITCETCVNAFYRVWHDPELDLYTVTRAPMTDTRRDKSETLLTTTDRIDAMNFAHEEATKENFQFMSAYREMKHA